MTSLKEYKAFFAICVLVAVLILVVHVFSLFWPRYDAFFFELGLLGKNKKAEDYYPNNSSNVELGSNATWFIYVHNHMGSPQNVSVRVKLLNSTMQAPHDSVHEPSPYSYFAELPISLAVDETMLVPFSWSISEIESLNSSVVIKSLTVNDQTVEVNVSGDLETRFRLVFELWVYDQTSGQYRFYWESKREYYSASLYMWFSLTISSP